MRCGSFRLPCQGEVGQDAQRMPRWGLSGVFTLCRYIICVSPTGGCRQNRYILQQSSAYGADLFTPHLPQAASSPQAPQGEDNGVQTKFCTNIAQSNVWRNVTVSTGVPNRAARDTYIRRCGESPLKKSVPYERPLAAADS